MKKCISIITPVFNEENCVERCYLAIKELFEKNNLNYEREHIFCDNASEDRTIEILRNIAATDPCVKVILNARNFGILRSSFNALMASTGDGVVALFPADLQDPAESILDFIRLWEQGWEVVYGIRQNRPESFINRCIKSFYYRLVAGVSEIEVPQNVASFQFLDRKVVNALRQFEDYYPHIPSLIASCGFRRKAVPYHWQARKVGVAKNKTAHLIDEALNGLISFSKVPMRLCLLIGVTVSLFSLSFALLTFLLVIVQSLTGAPIAPPGIPTLIIAMFFLAGIQLFVLGVLGEYLAAIHFQVRKRPLVIERERLNFS